MFPFQFLRAFELLSLAYYRPGDMEIEHSLDIEGVQAEIVKVEDERLLIIHGTNEPDDWFRFNFMALPAQAKGDSGLVWHGGFLRYAQIVYGFAKNRGCTAVTGHSLGAAAAQIVGPSLKLPTLAVASPRPLLSKEQPPNHDMVQNFVRTDDTITGLPPSFFGYRHVGQVFELRPKEPHAGEDHRIEHYIAMIRDDAVEPVLV